ncbi:hypothetical protein FQN50_004448 [Emmonsiellopsis sp. PD_5]|nr:hypothetical protein FQN50_004448 [Emmonsiellopsis sp. PD_5]
MPFKPRFAQSLVLLRRQPPTNRRFWTGSTQKDHTVNKSKRGDTTEPQSAAATAGLKENKATKSKNAEKWKSNATTEHDLGKGHAAADDEFPEAPRPIVGMEDERGRVSFSL